MAMTYDPTTADPGTIQKIPAGELLIDPNVRTQIRLDKSFVSSIRVYGFEQYPVGYQDDDGKTHITIGQRRVSAALEIGWPVIPVVIKPKVQAEADRVEELRILTQLAENEHRTNLLESETAGAYKQLALLDVSEDQIARKTNAPKARIQTAIKVIDSTVAATEMEKHELTLDQAAVLIEFQDDKKALAELRETAKTRPDSLEHVAQSQRSRIARERHGQSVADKARADGWEVITRAQNDEYGYSGPSGVKSLRELCRADDTSRTALTVDDVAGLPGRVVIVDPRYHGDEADITWALRNHAKHGFADRFSYGSGGSKGPLSDEEKAARKQKRIDKAEMIDATAVRRAWIRDTLLSPTRKKYPDDAIAWIAGSLWHAGTNPSECNSDGIRFTAEHLLGSPLEYSTGVKNPDTGNYFRGTAEAEVHKLLQGVVGADHMRLALAITVGRVEELAGNPKAVGFGQDLRLAAYLRQLREWGYTLADVEQRIVDAADQNRKKAGRK